jgi:hypothetical protein
MITLSIDVTKLDKERFKAITRKNGEKALFCDLILIESQSDYGDYMVKQSISKEDRENGVQLPILGNAKNVQAGDKKPAKAKSAPARAKDDDGSEIPF